MRQAVVLATVYRWREAQLEFLVVHRVPDDGDFWQPITGGIEEGETVPETLVRELAEEVGITELLHLSDELRRQEWHGADNEGFDILHGAEVPAHAVVTLSDEHDDHRWLPLEEAVALLKFDNNKEALRLVQEYALGIRQDSDLKVVV